MPSFVEIGGGAHFCVLSWHGMSQRGQHAVSSVTKLQGVYASQHIGKRMTSKVDSLKMLLFMYVPIPECPPAIRSR